MSTDAPDIDDLLGEIKKRQESQSVFISKNLVAGYYDELMKTYAPGSESPTLETLIAILRGYIGDYELTHNHVPAHLLSMAAKLRFLEIVNGGSASLAAVKTAIEAKAAKVPTDKPFDHIYQVFGLDSVSYRTAMLDSIVPSEKAIDVLAEANKIFSESSTQAVELASQVRESTRTIEKLQLQVRELQTQLAAQQRRAFNVEIQQTKYDKLREIIMKELKEIEKKDQEEKARTSTAAPTTGDASGESEAEKPDIFLLHSLITEQKSQKESAL